MNNGAEPAGSTDNLDQNLSNSGDAPDIDACAFPASLRKLADAATAAGTTDSSLASGPDVQLANPATSPHIAKFVKFENQTLRALAAELSALGSDASIHLSGSFIHAPANLRPGSDIDMLVYSSALKVPAAYFEFLKKFEESAWQFKNTTGLHPVFFTQQINEFTYCDKARSTFSKPQTEIIPCHFLYYRDTDEILAREPYSLAKGLMKNSRSILGEAPTFPHASNHAFPALDHVAMLRWNIERAAADLILNHRLLPESFVVYRFADVMFSCLRIYATASLPFEDQSVPELLDSLDPQGAMKLAEQFKPLANIRQGEPVDARGDLDTLIKPALSLLEIIDRDLLRKPAIH